MDGLAADDRPRSGLPSFRFLSQLGVEELDQQKLPHRLELKYHAVADAGSSTGNPATCSLGFKSIYTPGQCWRDSRALRAATLSAPKQKSPSTHLPKGFIQKVGATGHQLNFFWPAPPLGQIPSPSSLHTPEACECYTTPILLN